MIISSYRLGDLVLLNLTETDENEILTEHPNSIGCKYILEKRRNQTFHNIDTIVKIVLEYINQNVNLLPIDISDCTVIHLRLGDVIAGNEYHEKQKRPLSIDYIKLLVSKDANKKYIIGKSFFAKPSSTNYDECISLSNEYLHNAIKELNAIHFDSGNADIDLCLAVKAKLFIQGKGFFSKLIVEIRKQLKLDNIETEPTD
jgi:hypothetical protein